MIFLGQFKAGEVVPYAERFHNDQGTADDPTSPSAKIRNLDGSWSALTTPAKLDNVTGLYGGTIDTTGLQPGLYLVSLSGTVSTSKTVGTVLAFRIIDNTEADVMSRLGVPAGASVSADVAAVKTDTGAIKAKTDNLPTDPASNTQVNTRLAAADYVAPDNASVAAIKAKTDNLPVNPAATSDIPTTATIADAVWDEAAIDHNLPGTIGERINAAGSVVDPLANEVPGAYPSGTAGYVLGTLVPGQITVVSPLSKDGGTITLHRGDDYYAVDGRALEWTDTGALWPDLTGAVVYFKAGSLAKSVTVVTATGANKKLRLELSKEDIDALPKSLYLFEIEAVLSNGHIVTLVTGKMYIY